MSYTYLILGDGNFSFSLSLLKILSSNFKLVATSLEAQSNVLRRKQAGDNLSKLIQFENAHVLHEVDCTKLSNYEVLKEISPTYDRVIFNFPHIGGKSKIQCNRILLKDFFVSLVESQLLSDAGEVHLTLCHGQGGTPGEDSQRGYENSWKAVEMAAEGGFVLDRIEPFNTTDYPEYTQTGYRGHSDKGFSVERSLCHVFRKPRPNVPSLHPTCYAHDISFWSNSGIDGDRFRNLVHKVIGACLKQTVNEFCVKNIELIEEYRPPNAAIDSNSEESEGNSKIEKLGVHMTEQSEASIGSGIETGTRLEGVTCSEASGGCVATKVSYCFRIWYQCRWASLSRTLAGHLQQLVRTEVSRQQDWELR